MFLIQVFLNTICLQDHELLFWENTKDKDRKVYHVKNRL
jgi:hypothetical protein